MTETDAIVAAYRRAAAAHVRAALATVVRVDGSAYRQPGARMLVTEAGDRTGMVSAGCLEADVRERAALVMQTGRTVCLTYDATTDHDLVWGLGSGCNGIVHVLVEPAGPRLDELVRFLDICSRGPRRGAVATVFRSADSETPPGTRVFLGADDGATFGPGIPAPAIAPRLAADLRAAVSSGASRVEQYDAGIEVFIEVIEPRVPLVIFGAGSDVSPLVMIARQLGWHTTVVDTQARDASLERFAHADAVVLCRPEEVDARVALTESSVTVLMTHNFAHDAEVLPVLLRRGVRYAGCLGPARRTARLLSQVRRLSPAPHPQASGPLHAPVGIDIGAEAPSEIALSIAAEILAVIRGRAGGPLRGRSGSIHGERSPSATGDASPGATSALPATVYG